VCSVVLVRQFPTSCSSLTDRVEEADGAPSAVGSEAEAVVDMAAEAEAEEEALVAEAGGSEVAGIEGTVDMAVDTAVEEVEEEVDTRVAMVEAEAVVEVGSAAEEAEADSVNAEASGVTINEPLNAIMLNGQ
jgi:hypothetical protein